jgi:cell division inhibitor SepF
MAGALRKTMIYLGLAEDDERYEAYDGYDEADAPDEDDEDDLVRDEHRAPVTPINRGHMARVVPGHPMEMHRISTIHPRTYNEAKVIGEAFRAGTPVIMNLTDMDESDAKRLVDFAAGLVFGLRGSIERVTSKVFLLSPAHIEVAPANEVRATTEGGLFNQS